MLVTSVNSRLEAQVQYQFSAIVDHDTDGYWARCPELGGCYAQGGTYEEALSNLRETIAQHLEDRVAYSEDIPPVETISLTTVEAPG